MSSRNVFLSFLAVTASDTIEIRIESSNGSRNKVVHSYLFDIELGTPRSGHNFSLHRNSGIVPEVAAWCCRIVGPTLPKVLEEIKRDLGLLERIRYKVDVFYDVFNEMCESIILQAEEHEEDEEEEESAEVQPSYNDPVIHGLGTCGQL